MELDETVQLEASLAMVVPLLGADARRLPERQTVRAHHPPNSTSTGKCVKLDCGWRSRPAQAPWTGSLSALILK